MLVKRREPSLRFATITNLKRISNSFPSLLLPQAHVFYIILFNSTFFLIFWILITFAFSATKTIYSNVEPKSTFLINTYNDSISINETERREKSTLF